MLNNFNDTQAPDTAPGPYYVTCRNDSGEYWLMSGPYADHAAALADVRGAMTAASGADARAWWLSWGTSRVEGCDRPGNLQKLGLFAVGGAA